MQEPKGRWGQRLRKHRAEGRIRVQIGGRPRAERTMNMAPMFVTLDVSRLSGWLNADAYCREPNGGQTMRGEVRAAGCGRRRATAVRAGRRGGLDCRLGAGHGEERSATPNIKYMFVTLEVSRLSGWLNADAPCRESKGGQTARYAGAGGRRGASVGVGQR